MNIITITVLLFIVGGVPGTSMRVARADSTKYIWGRIHGTKVRNDLGVTGCSLIDDKSLAHYPICSLHKLDLELLLLIIPQTRCYCVTNLYLVVISRTTYPVHYEHTLNSHRSSNISKST